MIKMFKKKEEESGAAKPPVASKNKTRLDITKEFAAAASAQFGTKIKFILLFGSVAKGTDNEESDIDLMIVSDDNSLQKRINDIVADFLLKYQELPSPLVCSSEDLKMYKNFSFYRNVMKEGKILYET